MLVLFAGHADLLGAETKMGTHLLLSLLCLRCRCSFHLSLLVVSSINMRHSLRKCTPSAVLREHAPEVNHQPMKKKRKTAAAPQPAAIMQAAASMGQQASLHMFCCSSAFAACSCCQCICNVCGLSPVCPLPASQPRGRPTEDVIRLPRLRQYYTCSLCCASSAWHHFMLARSVWHLLSGISEG
jgi:hypothetical protein